MLEPRTDFLDNADGDFPLEDTVVNGVYQDTPIGFSDRQHARDNILYHKGWLKHAPTTGFAASSYYNSEMIGANPERELRIVLQADGYDFKTGCIQRVSGGEGFFIDDSFIYRVK